VEEAGGLAAVTPRVQGWHIEMLCASVFRAVSERDPNHRVHASSRNQMATATPLSDPSTPGARGGHSMSGSAFPHFRRHAHPRLGDGIKRTAGRVP
jgi:hypothetical protein